MESHSGRLMEKVSPYGYIVTVKKAEGDFPNHRARWKVYSIIADSYMDLIAGIDSIQSSDDLDWGKDPNDSTDDLRISGFPRKSEGKWVAFLYGQFRH